MSLKQTSGRIVALVLSAAVAAGVAHAGFGIGMSGAVKNKAEEAAEKVATLQAAEDAAAAAKSGHTLASLEGSWFLTVTTPAVDYHYMVMSANGIVTDFSSFNLAATKGTSSILPTGHAEITIRNADSTTMVVLRALLSTDASTASVQILDGNGSPIGAGNMQKIAYPGASGNWSGSLDRTSPAESKAVTISVAASGAVAVGGLAGPVTGMIMKNGSVVVGFLRTGEVDAWNEVRLAGTLAGNAINGTIGVDASSPNDVGTFTLTK